MISLGLVFIVIIGLAQDDKPKLQDEKTSYELHKEIEKLENPEETVQKTFSNNGVELAYQVGIENGVEETPPPDILVKMQESYTEEQKEENRLLYAEFIEDRKKLLEKRSHSSYAWKKSDIDSRFTCYNYNELAYQYQGMAYGGFMINGKYDGTFEGYIYWKAFHECIDPKYDEKYEKVMKELEEVYAEN